MMLRVAIALALALCSAAQPPPPIGLPFKMNAGGPALAGIGYFADRTDLIVGNAGFSFTSGPPVTVPAGADNAEIYKTERVGVGSLHYTFIVPSGKTYVVSTKHAESYFTEANKRRFNIEVNDVVKETNVDIFDQVGRDVALDFTFNGIVPVNAGPVDVIRIKFVGTLEKPIVNGIEIKEMVAASADVRKINVGGPAIDDYEADPVTLITGNAGFTYTSTATVTGVPAGGNMDVYKTERVAVGPLTYAIPVNAGTYTVTMKFAESYFNAANKRKFGIEINGVEKEASVDIFDRAGGRDVALELAFPGIVPDNGLITIKLVVGLQKPILNALILAGGGVSTPSVSPAPTVTPAPSVSPPVPADPTCPPDASTETSLLMLNAGGPALPAISFTADDPSLISNPKGNQYMGGPLMGTDPLALVYKTERWSSQTLTYTVAVPTPGTYIVKTYHSEGFFGEAGKRVMSVEINGVVTNANVDVFVASGGMDKPLVLTNAVVVAAGTTSIVIKFVKITQNPAVNGISVSQCGGDSNPPPGPMCMNIGGPALPAIGYVADDPSLIVGPAGSTYPSSATVTVPAGQNNMQVYKTERFARGTTLTYKFALAAGTYKVETMHAESFFTAPNKRKFGIKVNGITFETGIDLFASVGKDVAVVKTFDGIQTAGDDSITIQFVNELENPAVNAICLSSTTAPPLSPTPSPAVVSPSPAIVSPSPPPPTAPTGDILRLNVGGPAAAGYVADNPSYVTSTSNIATNGAIITLPSGATNAAVFGTERWTTGPSLDFRIPVPAGGPYIVTLEFAETFFDSAGRRVFDAYINGVEVKANLDVFAEAGGMNTAIALHYPNIARNAAGNILVSLKRGIREPMINAIMVSTPDGNPPAPSVTPSPVPSPADPNACDVATTQTGRDASPPGSFMMNVAGLPVPPFGAENVNYIVGPQGTKAESNVPVNAPQAAAIFLTNRWTSAPEGLTYSIPVPDGPYSVTTYHSESFFSENGKRVFNILINGNPVAANLDVHAEVGKNVARIATYDNIPSVGGFIEIKFQKVSQNPFVNAIKVSGPGANVIAIGGREDGLCKAPGS